MIELLTVIAIIGILAAIIVPVAGKVRETATKATCAGNLRQIALGTIAYANDNKGLLPTRLGSADYPHAIATAVWADLSPYFGNPPKDKLMFCPGPLKEWRNPDYPGGSYSAITGRYVTYSYFANVNLDAAVKTGFNMESTPLRKLNKVPERFALWTCLTCATSDGHFHGHGDPDTEAATVRGQNAARADGSVRWVGGDDIMLYNQGTGVSSYGPKPGP